MSLKLQVPPKTENLRPTITVIGVGGAGGNAVNNMIASKLEGVRFVAANTDAQALENSLAETRIQLGLTVTQGLGAGALPDTGRIAADEALDEIEEALSGSHMAFVTAGMGGGTGTGAAPVIAKKAREMNILTVGVVTRPFHFEGSHRMRIADMGIEELQSYVDTLIVIPNQNLFRIANEKTTFADAFSMADNVLHSGVRGVTDLMIMPGLINLDFADIRAVMGEMGKAMMGTGEAEGDRRALDAAEAAISNPLLDDVSMKGARGMLINITGGPDMTLFEVDEAANRVREEVDPNANIIFGATFNDNMEGKMRVSIVATGIDVVENTRAKPSGSGNFASASSFNFNKPRKPASEMAHAASEESVLKRPAPLKIEPRRPVAEAPSLDLGNMTTASVEADAEPEIADREDEDSFSPPKPVEPNVRSTSHARVAESFTKTVEEPVAAAPKERARPEASSFSLIQKLTNRAKSRDKERETVAAESPEEAEIRDTSPKRKAAAEEEYLDIPAFLRRQAN